MRSALVLTAVLLAACGQEMPERREDAVLPPEPPALLTPAPGAAVTTYTCANGETAQARYPDANTAIVTYGGETFILTSAVTGSGARYIGDDREWRTSGSTGGTLRLTQDDSDLAGRLIAECSTASGVDAAVQP